MNIVIIIPTYNEGESIGKLIDAVFSETSHIKNHTFGVLIVDGNSPDDTQSIVTSKKKDYPGLELLIEKEKRGLGSAYVTGMNHALSHMNADAFIEFDGDFQHDPKDIYKLVAKLDEGYEHIIGSRYIEGGTIPQEWPWYRKFLSSFGNIIVQLGLAIPTNDNTSGFKLTKAKDFRDILPLNLDELLSTRHAYKIHFLNNLIKGGAKTVEVPINFLNRHKGVSKSTIEDIIESLKVVAILRLQSIVRFFRKDKNRVNKKAADR
jgi:dolichol-phosphate mannosyltransferase